jgi:hypothetical protein
MKAALLLLLICSSAGAGNSTQTLPKGVWGFRLNNVFVTGADYMYGPDGSKASIADANASSIKEQALHMLNGNSLGGDIYNQILNIVKSATVAQLGLNLAESVIQAMDLGQLKLNVSPTIKVISPTIMRGMTRWWSLILNVPIVNMNTEVSWQYIPGSSTATLDSISALAGRMGFQGIPNSSQIIPMAENSLAQKGYKPLRSDDRTFVGDSQLMNLFSLGRFGALSFGTMNTIGLPTGPKHDPDDLTDIGQFHHTSIEQELTAVYVFTRSFRTYVSGGVRYTLPEKGDYRIPAGADDFTPDKSQTESVTRQVGLGTFVEGGFSYRILPRFVFGAGLVHRSKAADTFRGNRGLNYGLLQDTFPYDASTSNSYKVGITYDPLTNYRLGSIPLMADLNYEEVFSGVNVPATKIIFFSVSSFF